MVKNQGAMPYLFVIPELSKLDTPSLRGGAIGLLSVWDPDCFKPMDPRLCGDDSLGSESVKS